MEGFLASALLLVAAGVFFYWAVWVAQALMQIKDDLRHLSASLCRTQEVLMHFWEDYSSGRVRDAESAVSKGESDARRREREDASANRRYEALRDRLDRLALDTEEIKGRLDTSGRGLR